MCNNTRRRNREISDGRIITAIRSREPNWSDLFDVLVERHQDALGRRCLAYLKHPEDAADAVQETLFRAYRAIDGFNGDATFRTWLFAIADNECHTLARKRRRYLWDADADGMAPATLAGNTEHVLHEHDDSTAEVVHRAIAQIPPLGRDVLQLRYFGELSIEEIASTLGVGISAAKMRLYRAQEQIANIIKGHTESWNCAA